MFKALTPSDLRYITGLAISCDPDASTGLPTLEGVISDLGREAQVELCALMYFGRGDFGSDFAAALDHVQSITAANMLRSVHEKRRSLAIYLVTGLALMLEGEVSLHSSRSPELNP